MSRVVVDSYGNASGTDWESAITMREIRKTMKLHLHVLREEKTEYE